MEPQKEIWVSAQIDFPITINEDLDLDSEEAYAQVLEQTRDLLARIGAERFWRLLDYYE